MPSASGIFDAVGRREPVAPDAMPMIKQVENKGEVVNLVMIILSLVVCLFTLPFSIVACFNYVYEYERAVILRLGRLKGCRGPGVYFTLPCIDEAIKVDLRTVSMDVPPQEILTRDSVTVSVDAVVFYRVSDPIWSQTHVENASMSTRLLAQTTLRNMMGVRSLYEILTERDHITIAMQDILDSATEDWGIKVERVEVKDVRIPVNLQRAMAAEAEAQREATAKVVMANGELKASHILRDAALNIQSQPQALQLRYLQSLTLISAEKNHSIIFPIPLQFMQSLSTGLQSLNRTSQLRPPPTAVSAIAGTSTQKPVQMTQNPPPTSATKSASSAYKYAFAVKNDVQAKPKPEAICSACNNAVV